MKIKVCLPYYERIYEPCLDSIKKSRSGFDLDLSGILHSNFILCGRNYAFNSGKSDEMYQKFFNVDYFLSLDQDISFDVGDIQRLLDDDKDIVCGMYAAHSDPKNFQCGYLKEDGSIKSRLGYSDKNSGTIPIDFCGCGFILIKKHVLEELEYPWFRSEIIKIGSKQKYETEDMGFCRHAKRNGFEIHVNTDVQVGHVFRNPKKYELF